MELPWIYAHIKVTAIDLCVTFSNSCSRIYLMWEFLKKLNGHFTDVHLSLGIFKHDRDCKAVKDRLKKRQQQVCHIWIGNEGDDWLVVEDLFYFAHILQIKMIKFMNVFAFLLCITCYTIPRTLLWKWKSALIILI